MLRPIVFRVLLVLALGGATSVVIAWLLAAWLPHSHLSKRFNLVGTPAQYISVYELSRPGMVRRSWRAGYVSAAGAPQMWQLLSPSATVALHLKTSNHDRSWGMLPLALDHPARAAIGAEDARGWPLLCLWCALDEPAIEGATNSRPVRGGIAVSRLSPTSTGADFRALPLIPIWRGLMADTVIFAAAWAVGIPLFVRVRAAVRRGRGLCPACAYNLRGAMDPGCPECGWNRGPVAR